MMRSDARSRAPTSTPPLDEPCPTFMVGNVVIFREQVGILRLTQARDQRVLLRDLHSPVGDARAAFDAVEPGRCNIGVMHCLGCPDQRFRGYATEIDAGATDRAVPDERDLRALLGSGDRGREAGRAGADDNKVVPAIAVVGTRVAGVGHRFDFRMFRSPAESAVADGMKLLLR